MCGDSITWSATIEVRQGIITITCSVSSPIARSQWHLWLLLLLLLLLLVLVVMMVVVVVVVVVVVMVSCIMVC